MAVLRRDAGVTTDRIAAPVALVALRSMGEDHVCRMGLEGIVSKWTDAPYPAASKWLSRRTRRARQRAASEEEWR